MEQMRTFLAVADCLNFTKAAERLYLSQPTVSRQIQSLEEECKTPLLVRTRKEVRLTPAGAIMVSHLKKSLEEIEAGLEEIQASSNGITGKLNIGVLEGFETEPRVLKLLVEFGKKYSELTVNINYCSFGELRRGLKDETFIAPDEKDSPFRLEDTNNLLSHYGFQCKKMKYVKNHESQLLNVAAGNGVAIACGDVPQVKNSMLFHFMELSKEEHVLHMIYAWKKENYNPALALFLNGLSEEDES
jgi:DNA-binding transcriptional LysR family regulator